MTKAPTLTTDRLTLRHHHLGDFDAYAALWATEEAKFMGGPLGRDAAWGAFCSDVAHWQLHGFGAWAIDDGKVTVGQVALGLLPNFPERELGWLIYPQFRGQGYATEAATTVRNYVFEVLKWSTLVSYIDPDNQPSINVATRLGAEMDANADRPDATDLVFRYSQNTAILQPKYSLAENSLETAK